MSRRAIAVLLTLGALFGLAACNGLYLGDNPSRDVRKEAGPLTQPPRSALDGTARDAVPARRTN